LIDIYKSYNPKYPPPKKTKNKTEFNLRLNKEDWKIEGIQLYIIIYCHDSLGVFCGMASEGKDNAIEKELIDEKAFETTKDLIPIDEQTNDGKFIRYIPQKKIVKSNEILITGKNNKGDFEAHCIDLNKQKYFDEVDKRVKRIIKLIENEKDIRKKK
jgi:hypothetical protein